MPADWDAITWLTMVLVIVTSIYAWLTYRIARSMWLQTEAATRPYMTVSAHTRVGTPFLYLRITNLGKTSATKLKLDIDRSFFRFGRRDERHDLKATSLFLRDIDSFPPGMTVDFDLGLGHQIFGDNADDSLMPQQFLIAAAYQGGGRKYSEQHHVDLRAFSYGAVSTDSVGTATIEGSRHLEKIRQSLDQLTRMVSQLAQRKTNYSEMEAQEEK